MPRQRVTEGSRSSSLRAIRDNPALPAFLRTLSARALAQLCARVGIGDAVEFMALAPAHQLIKALDASVWKAPRPGRPEEFDPDEFVEWLWVWLEVGDAFTAQRLGAIPDADLTLYLSRLISVSTGEMWGFERSTEIGNLDRIYKPSYDETGYGPYFVNTLVDDHWEIAHAALDAMWHHSPERLLHLFAQLSGDESMRAPEIERDSSNQDFIFERDSSRERRGYVTATGARAFLAMAQTMLPEELRAMTDYDLETRRHLSRIESSEEQSRADASYDGDFDSDGESESEGDGAGDQGGDGAVADVSALVLTEEDALVSGAIPDATALAALRVALEAAGLLEQSVEMPLLTHDSSRGELPVVKVLARLAHDDPTAFDTRGRELAYLAGVLIAAVTVNNEALSGPDARSAALAFCNLGYEILRESGEDARLGSEPGLVRLFLVGWQLTSEVPGRVVDAFKRSLEQLKSARSLPKHDWLVQEAQSAYADLHAAVSHRNYAAARDALLMLSFVFEPRSCRAAAPLMDEVPRLVVARGDSDGAQSPRWIESLADLHSIAELLASVDSQAPRKMR